MGKKLEYLITFLVILSLNFALPRMMPGDPFLYISGDDSDISVDYSREQIEYYREYYGMDQPMYKQYGAYLAALARGDLGFSYTHQETVNRLIINRIPWTLLIAASSLLFSLILGMGLAHTQPGKETNGKIHCFTA